MREGPRFTRALGVALAIPALLALAGCAVSSEQAAATTPAGAGAETAATPSPTQAEPAYQQPTAAPAANIDQVLADLKRAEDDLALAVDALGASKTPKYPGGTPAPTATAGSAGAPPPAPMTSPQRSVESELSSDPCMTACRALASMTRATTHLCDLAGDADPRCDNARSRLRGARERVHGSCACGSPG